MVRLIIVLSSTARISYYRSASNTGMHSTVLSYHIQPYLAHLNCLDDHLVCNCMSYRQHCTQWELAGVGGTGVGGKDLAYGT
jgi:hypothetical protein